MESISGWTKAMRSCIAIFCFQYTIEDVRSTSGRLPIPQLPKEPAHKPVDIVRRHFDLSVGDACIQYISAAEQGIIQLNPAH